MKKLKILKIILLFADSAIITLIVFFLDLDIVALFEGSFSIKIQGKLQLPDFRLTLNVTFFILIIRAITSLLQSPVKVNMFMNNCDGSTSTELRVIGNGISNPKTLILGFSVNYGNRLLKYFVKKLGGIHIFINNTNWTTIQPDLSVNSTYRNSIKQTLSPKYVVFSIDEILADEQIKTAGQIKFKILSSATDSIGGDIIIKMDNKELKLYQKLKFLLLKLLVECDECNHEVHLSVD